MSQSDSWHEIDRRGGVIDQRRHNDMANKASRHDTLAAAVAAISASRLRGTAAMIDTIAAQRKDLGYLLKAISNDATRLIGTLERGQLTLAGAQLHEVVGAIEELGSALPDDAEHLDEHNAQALAELSRRIALVQPEATLAYLGDAAAEWAEATADLGKLVTNAERQAQELAEQYSEMLGEIRDIAVKLDQALSAETVSMRYAERPL